MVSDLIKYPTNILPAIIENYMRLPTLMSLIVIFQGTMGGLGMPFIPARISQFVEHPLGRLLFVSAISFTTTQDIETSIATTLIFFALMYVLRTKEEREALGFIF